MLMMNTWTPFADVPAKYSGAFVVGAPEVGVNGFAGAPTVASWWKASSSVFVMMASWVLLRLLSCKETTSVRPPFGALHIGC